MLELYLGKEIKSMLLLMFEKMMYCKYNCPCSLVIYKPYCVFVICKAALKEAAFAGFVLNLQHRIFVHEMVLITQLPFSLRIKNPD